MSRLGYLYEIFLVLVPIFVDITLSMSLNLSEKYLYKIISWLDTHLRCFGVSNKRIFLYRENLTSKQGKINLFFNRKGIKIGDFFVLIL